LLPRTANNHGHGFLAPAQALEEAPETKKGPRNQGF
jgi:hypothetical protein